MAGEDSRGDSVRYEEAAESGALTKGDQFSVAGFAWSPDGKKIAFSASRDPDPGSAETEQLYVLDLADLHVRKLIECAGPEQQSEVVAGRQTDRLRD